MAEPTRIRATMSGDAVVVRVLMTHEMETGQRKDSSGSVVPAHFIHHVVAQHNDRTVLEAEWGPAVSKNPYLQFQFKGGKSGDKLTIRWVDNKGDARTDQIVIP